MVSCSHCPLASHVDPTARTRTLIQPVSALFNPVSMVLAEKELNKTLEKVFASYAWEVHYRLFVLSRNKKKKRAQRARPPGRSGTSRQVFEPRLMMTLLYSRLCHSLGCPSSHALFVFERQKRNKQTQTCLCTDSFSLKRILHMRREKSTSPRFSLDSFSIKGYRPSTCLSARMTRIYKQGPRLSGQVHFLRRYTEERR